MRRAAMFFTIGLLMASQIIGAETLSYGAFSIQWPQQCNLVPGSDPDQYTCANGDVLVIDVLQLKKPPNAEATARYLANVREATRRKFKAPVRPYEVEVMPVRDENLAPAITLVYAAHSTRPSVRPRAFIVYFALISERGLVNVGVEGVGDAMTAYEKYRKAVETAKWN